MTTRLLRVLLVPVVALAGCRHDDGATGPEPSPLELGIVSPADGAFLPSVGGVTLVGEGRDPPSGALPDWAFAWRSHRDGTLGTGRLLHCYLSPGAHRITLAAMSADGRSDSVRITIAVDSNGVGHVKWRVALPGATSTYGLVGPFWMMAEGPDGTLYAPIAYAGYHHTLVAVSPDGVVRWVKPVNAYLVDAPVVGPDGVIYLGLAGGAQNAGVLALNPDGGEHWYLRTRDVSPLSVPGSLDVYAAPAVAPDGSLRVITQEADAPVYAVEADGAVRWRTPTNLPAPYQARTLVVGTDGTTYVATFGDSVAAIAADGAWKWTVGVRDIGYRLSGAIGADGSLYVFGNAGAMDRVSPAGVVTAGPTVPLLRYQGRHGGATLGSDGRVFVARSDGSVAVLSAALDDGVIWSRGEILDLNAPVSDYFSAAAVARNVVYVLRGDELWAYNMDGTVRFRAITRGASPAGDSPIVGRDGTIYVRGYNTIVAIWDTLGPDPASPWPAYRGGASRSGTPAR